MQPHHSELEEEYSVGGRKKKEKNYLLVKKKKKRGRTETAICCKTLTVNANDHISFGDASLAF